MQRLILRLARAAVRVYYRASRLGLEVPARGPLLLVGNHPNGLVDPILVASATSRPVRFLGKAPLFDLPVLGSLMRGLRALPIHRAQDGADTALNQETFAAVFAALERGQAICLFPEGKSHNEPALARLKTGAARMALGAEARAGWRLGVRVVPVGLVYRAKRRLHSEVAVWVGAPLDVHDLAKRFAADERAAVAELTERIARALAEVTLNLERWEDLPLLDLAARVARDEKRPSVAQLKAFADAVPRLRELEPARLAALAARLAAFRERLHALGLEVEDAGVSYGPRMVTRFVLVNLARGLVGLPLALAGALLWCVPWFGVRLLATLVPSERDTFATVRILAGALLFPIWWLALGLTTWLTCDAPWALALALAAPPLGLFSLAFRDWRGEVLSDASVFLRLAARRNLRAHLCCERDALAVEVATLRARALESEMPSGPTARSADG
jgi:1-acyl-sn-glycerol-3-phosphate acyltransferase